MTDLGDRTLGDVVADNPDAARILDGFGLDFCCRGDRTLTDACAEAGVEADDVAARLDDLGPRGAAAWAGLEPSDGCDSYRSLYERLEALELDTQVHIHKENHVLFPAALQLADS